MSTKTDNFRYHYNANSVENSIEVSGYPCGGYRTERRYWVETKKNFGQRGVFQTKNPKTGQWFKPKKGTYSDMMIVQQSNENDYVSFTGLSVYACAEHVAAFNEKHTGKLAEDQQRTLNAYLKAKKADDLLNQKVG